MDPKRIDIGTGSINLWSKNEERKVKVSTLSNKYWAVSLSFNHDKFDAKKVARSLRQTIESCQ
jgi:hypothetical protein